MSDVTNPSLVDEIVDNLDPNQQLLARKIVSVGSDLLSSTLAPKIGIAVSAAVLIGCVFAVGGQQSKSNNN